MTLLKKKMEENYGKYTMVFKYCVAKFILGYLLPKDKWI